VVQIVRKFADLQENNESIGSQHNSDDDSVSETVSQKLLSDFDGMLTDDMEGNIRDILTTDIVNIKLLH